jgi:isopentenyl-diphosphate Delta-isomerase
VSDDDEVILVDAADRPLGRAPKLDVHRDGRLHRAVSVVLMDAAGRVLIQRRALGKYHSAGLWSNTCCGHPRPGEDIVTAGQRRLHAELGIEDVDLRPISSFVYRADLGGGLVEHELDHVLLGRWQGTPQPDPQEVADWRWEDLSVHPARYSAWCRAVLAAVCDAGANG